MTRRRAIANSAVIGACVLVLLATAAVLASNPRASLLIVDWQLAAFTLALAVAMPLHLRLPGGLDASPVAPSLGVALALTPWTTSQNQPVVTCLVVAALAVGIGAGLLIGAALGQHRPSVGLLAGRFLSGGLVVVVYRNLPLFDGHTAAAMAPAWAHEGWRTAGAMIVCGGCAIAADLAFITARMAPAGRVRATFELLVAEVAPIWLAVLGIAVAIALGYGPLGLWAVPIMASPLLLMRAAIKRQSSIARVRKDTIQALSDLTDRTGYTTLDHGRRVRDLSRSVGLQLMLSERELRDLENAALLHDVGQLGLHDPLPYGATSEAAPSDQVAIAADGANIVRELGGMERVAEIVARQATPYRNVRELGEALPLECRILKVCNAYDDLTRGRPGARAKALERISLGMGYEYDPDVVDLLTNLTEPAR